MSESGVIIEVEKVFSGHRDWVRSCISFGDPYNCVLTCSDDATLRIFHVLTDVSEIVVSESEERGMSSVIKWDETGIFLSGSDGENVRVHRLVTGLEGVKVVTVKEFRTSCSINRMAKLTSDLFLICSTSEMCIFSYSKGELVRKLYAENISWTSVPVVSKRFENCFYINTKTSKNPVKLINYSTKKVEKIFNDHDKSLNFINTYIDRRSNAEVLLCGGIGISVPTFDETMAHKLLIYDTETCKVKKSYIVDENVKEVYAICPILVGDQSYIFMGDDCGNMHIMDLNTQKMIAKRKIHFEKSPDEVNFEYSIFCLDVISFTSSRIKFLTGATDCTARIVSVQGLKLDFENERDLKERWEYMMEEVESFFGDKVQQYTLTIKIYSTTMKNVLKTFLLL